MTSGFRAVVVDMPIGLPALGDVRRCDVLARKRLGPDGRSRVFAAPPRELLELDTPESFQRAHRRAFGMGAGLPVWGIVPKLREVDEVMTPGLQRRIREFHPDLAWRGRVGRTLGSKHVHDGITERLALLRSVVPRLDDALAWRGRLGRAAHLDDLLDALIGLLVARGLARSPMASRRLPGAPPPTDARGLRMEIWF